MMNESTFRAGIVYLGDYFKTKPEDEQYALIWEAVKNLSDEIFFEITKDLILTFCPTRMVPFPIVFHWNVAKYAVLESRPQVPRYKMIEAKEELADAETIEMLKDVQTTLRTRKLVTA